MLDYQPMNLGKLPPAFRNADTRRKLAQIVEERYSLAQESVGELQARWNDCDLHYFGPVPVPMKAPWEGAPSFEFTWVQQKVDQVTAHVCNPILRADPIAVVRSGGPSADRNEKVEAVLMHALVMSDIRMWLPQAVNVIQRRGTVVPRAVFKHGNSRKGPSIQVDLVDPMDVVAFPNTVWRTDDLVMHGTHHVMLGWEFRRHVDSRAFFADAKMPRGGVHRRLLQDGARPDNASRLSDTAIELCDLTVSFSEFKLKGEDSYRIQYCPETQEIVRAVKVEPGSPNCLRKLFLHHEVNTYFNRTNRVYAILAPHQFASAMKHMTVWLSFTRAGGIHFGYGIEMNDQSMKLKPWHMYKMTSPAGRIETFKSDVDLAAFPLLMQQAERDIDAAARISANGAGAVLRGGSKTAAETMEIAYGQEQGVRDDIRWLGVGLSDLFEYILRELIAPNWEEWHQAYADVLPSGVTQADLERNWWIDINGEDAASTPGVVLQQSIQLLQMLGPAGQAVIQQMVQAHPESVIELWRSVIEQTNLSGKEKIVPPSEEMASEQSGYGADVDLAGAFGGAEGLPGLGGLQVLPGIPEGPLGGAEGRYQ